MTVTDSAAPAAEAAKVWRRGITWMCANLELFRPADVSDPDKLKAIVELALFYSVVVSWCRNGRHIFGKACHDHRMRGMGTFLVEFMSQPEMAEWARKVPALFNPYFIGYLAMRSVGYQTPEWEDALVHVVAAGFPECLETTPYRRLEFWYVARKTGLGNERFFDRGAYAETTLARCTNPVYLDRAGAYSITHTLFYLTDFGRKDTRMQPQQHDRALAIVRMLLIRYRRKGDWDLVGELLINLVGLGDACSPIFHSLAREIFAAQRSDGSIPGPNFQFNSEPTAAYVFEHCYHTTLVVLWLCASIAGAQRDSL